MDYDRLRELQAKFDENPRRYFAPLANEYRKGGNPKRAIEICRAHLAQMPGHMSGQVVFGQSLFEGGEYEEARKVFEGALVLDPENLIALRSLGDLSLQAGDTAQARSWYTRLLEADPKDAAVLALISEIDASPPALAAEPATSSELKVDYTFVDQPPIDASGAPATHSASPATAEGESSPEPAVAAESPAETARASEGATESEPRAAAAPEAPKAESDTIDVQSTSRGYAPTEDAEGSGADSKPAPPLGLEHHYPTSDSSADDSARESRSEAYSPEPPPIENFGEPPEPMGPDRDAMDWTAGPFAETGEHEGEATGIARGADAASSADVGSNAVDTASRDAQGSSFAGTNPEPFVNETMAQLYLQQGYKQLALRVYRQLSERKPQDQTLKDKIAEIEASQASEVSGAQPHARREEPPSVESPTPEPATPRAPSTESPLPHGPGSHPSSIESPGTGYSPVDLPPTSPSSEPDSIEAPIREEPRAEPEGIAARQPSIKEFFATLGRRRPQQPARSTAADAWRPEASAQQNTVPESGKPDTLDAVFAGAKVSSTDARAASTLAGAFSASARVTSPPVLNPTPTPRANPRLQTQESEEDVAKFRAWLDGLTGE